MAAPQRFLLTEPLCHIDSLDEGIARVSAAIAEPMRPFADALEISEGVAIQEIGRPHELKRMRIQLAIDAPWDGLLAAELPHTLRGWLVAPEK